MKNKKLLIILAVVFVLIAVVAIIFFVTGNKGAAESPQTAATEEANQVDFQQLAETAWNVSKSENEPEFLKKLDGKSTFTLSSYTQEEDGYYTVTFEVTSPNISDIMKKLDSELDISLLTEDEINQKISDAIDSADMLTSSQIAIVVTDEEGVNHIKFTQDFVNAMYGYIYNDALEELSDVLS